MSAAARMTAIAVGLAIAAGAGYWIAQLQHDTPQAPRAGAPHAAADTESPSTDERKILYYRNPMGLPDTSPEPKKDSMGMDYVPVYADDRADDAGVVVVSPARMQTLGVKTAEVELGAVDATVRASGRIEIDERSQVVVAPRFEGWIERLHVNAVGDPVKKGQALFTAYSPELQAAGEELRIADRLAEQSAAHDALASESARRLAAATRTRLRNLEVAGQTGARQVFHAPVSGVVLDKAALQGGRFMPGEALFRIADLSKVWVIADVYEQDLARVHVGQSASITLDAFPGRSFEARVAFLYPSLDAATRSTPIRLELDNAQGLLRPGMFAQVALVVGDTNAKTVVPSSAIIDDGARQIVLMALPEGRFKAQPVKLGQRGRDRVEVLEGLKAGERVVVSANFLIDSESQLKAALSNLVAADGADASGGDYRASATRYEAQGTLDAVDAETGSLTLTHGEIPALKWPAMTMDFAIAATLADLRRVKDIAPGTAVRFTFEEGEPGEYIITHIEPATASAAAPAAGAAAHSGGH